MKRIGIMGGTFNPIHKAHLSIARTAMDKFSLDKVIFVPSGKPPHKIKEELADKEHRYRMTELAIKKYPYFYLSRIELDREGYSYAVDTLKKLKRKFGRKAMFFYIMGLDSINEILTWKKPLDLFSLCEFIVATRPKTKKRTFRRLIKFPPLQKYVDKIHLIEFKEDISSTDIRNRIRTGKSIKGLMPKEVENYIRKYKIYD